MKKISLALSLLVCAIHAYILAIEMFFWNKPLGMKTFNLAPEFASATTAFCQPTRAVSCTNHCEIRSLRLCAVITADFAP